MSQYRNVFREIHSVIARVLGKAIRVITLDPYSAGLTADGIEAVSAPVRLAGQGAAAPFSAIACVPGLRPCGRFWPPPPFSL